IGTAVSFYIDENVVTLTNSDSPDKRPDVTKTEGKKVVVEYLDAVNDLFVEAIATGRGGGLTEQTVAKKFGRGAVLLAEEAMARGMIDKVEKPTLGYSRSDSENSDEEAEAMDLATRKSKHPALVAEVLKDAATAPPPAAVQQPPAATAGGGANEKDKQMEIKTLKDLKSQLPDLYEEAVQSGVTQERERVVAHIDLGEAYEAMPTALGFIKSGDDLRPTVASKYLAAGAKRKAVGDRQQETDAVAAVVNANGGPPAAPAAVEKDIGDLVADAMGLPTVEQIRAKKKVA